jgi:asparagine synthase (glutamine-hydrolysing)
MFVPEGLSPLETAAGFPLGPGPPLVLPAAMGHETPLAALEAVVDVSLRRPPCLVAFSGGRDSSLLLAAAVRTACHNGHPPPVAVTLRYPGVAEADESAWQERLVRHLGVADWLRVEVRGEVDLLGLAATGVLLRHGLLFPANAHALLPLLSAAPGGSLLVGLGGDELLTGHRWSPLLDVLARRRRLGRRHALRLAAACMPPPLRARLRGRGNSVARDLDWLRPAARHQLARLEHRTPDEPVGFRRAVAEAAARRGVTLVVDALKRLGRGERTDVVAPLLEPRFVAALGRAGGITGFGGRTAAMRAIAGGALPDDLLARRDKATFNRGFFGPASRAFAERWPGVGVDLALVDPDALRAAWLAPEPDFRSALLLQSAWLHQHGEEAVWAA